MINKTNAMRLLDSKGVPYQVFTYDTDFHSAEEVADIIGVPAAEVYKTLVVLREKGKPMLVMVPAPQQLDPKQFAKAIGEKKVWMASQKEAESLTGLQVGGISPLVLLNKGFAIYLDASARTLTSLNISAGQRGVNLRLKVEDLVKVTGCKFVAATSSF
ncbi:MAG: aminoacyl-tRNA deacylase [Chloroflexi bacterium]|nr:aminoacyl-tRNA deacylase [Chloroflexota bacterium]